MSRHEWIVVAALLLAGVGFRLAHPSRMSVEHFDEGVYASNIWFGPKANYQYPLRRLYAPPLLPSLIEWSIIAERIGSPDAVRPSNLATMAPSLLAGCLTLLAVWWTARDWFGPAVGLGSLALAAVSDFHAMYSRAALTEALLVLFLLLSLWALRRALSQGRFALAVLTGLLTGFAWWTKYNGWLPLVIGLAAIGLTVASGRGQRKHWRRLTVCWLGVTAVAVLVWSPYLWSLQASGGYAEVSANHKQYVVGLAGWLPGLARQYENLLHYDGLASCGGIALAALVTAGASSFRRQRWVRCCALALILAALSAWVGSAAVLFALALGFVVAQVLGSTSADETQADGARFAWQLSAAWIVGLFLAIPLYHPYPRLTLPWICGLWLVGTAGIGRLLESKLFTAEDESPNRRFAWVGVAATAGVLLALAAGGGRLSWRPVAWQDRTAWEPIAERIIEDVSDRLRRGGRDPNESFVFVYGEPALFFHLSARGEQAYIPAGDLTFVQRATTSGIPIFLVAGPHAERSPSFREEFASAKKQLGLVAEYNYAPSDLVLLNQYPPHELKRDRPITQKVTLYEVVRER